MVTARFTFAKTPKIYFGAGTFDQLGRIVSELGKTVLIVTGSKSLQSSGRWESLTKSIGDESLSSFHVSTTGEPSPGLVDSTVSDFRDREIDVVLAVGGGSVLDAGKAISAMLLQDGSVVDFLEGVGTGEPHNGIKVPFVAVPTTSGTGSEVTKNAVLSRIGPDGYKKSLRHDNLVPDVALIDPELMLSCPANITASTGMDACTQLIEAYVSKQATPLTDALAFDGLRYIKDNLVLACTSGADDVDVRAGMAYGALLSGMALANAGLGIVHGLASPLGAHFPVPHGVACGTLLISATRENIQALRDQDGDSLALSKYARVGWLLSAKQGTDIHDGCDLLIQHLETWTREINLPLLSDYGVHIADIEKIVKEASHKNNPVDLSTEGIRRILRARI